MPSPKKTAPSYAALVERMAALQRTLVKKKLTVAVAESCTGGLLGAVLSSHGGSSAFFRGGAEVYGDEAKTIYADVPPQLIASHGAVSSVVGGALARGARVRLGAKIGLGITGIAGPGGATAGKPVGLTYVALDSDGRSTVKKHIWSFDREGNRLASVGAALDLLEDLVA
jgi:nicotinamide-nucleotide amidase